MCIDEDKWWKAVVDCDSAYDDSFFYAVKTVGVYCRPSCKSRTPLRKNVSYFETREAAERAGFRPCKRCRPDLSVYAPVSELAKQTKDLMDTYFRARDRLAAEQAKLGVSAGHLAAVFKRQYGLAPSQYVTRLRINHAMHLLAQTALPIIEVADEVGFNSLPSFYNFFKKHTGITPNGYRKGVEP